MHHDVNPGIAGRWSAGNHYIFLQANGIMGPVLVQLADNCVHILYLTAKKVESRGRWGSLLGNSQNYKRLEGPIEILYASYLYKQAY